ncbi:hypothetical protein CUMW_117170 [Citrus unshiu]|nr:hypothetical protein CUMW_117170 [Citrus unshiu]
MGQGTYLPAESIGEDGLLAVDCFTFSSSIADHLSSASLVISHAEISKLEAARVRLPILGVVREHIRDLTALVNLLIVDECMKDSWRSIKTGVS